MSNYKLLFLALGLTLVACGDPEPGSGDGDGDGDTDMDTDMDTGTGDGDGDDMTVDCATEPWDINGDPVWKGTWMATCVVPEIAPLMQAIDPVLYENFSCAHCHGSDLGGGEFTMPGGKELDWAATGEWNTDFYDPAAMDGPMVEVSLTVAELLGYEPFSMDNPDGFGCGSCHIGL